MQSTNAGWTSTPNLRKALTTNIPVLNGILLGLVGALFAAIAIAEFASLKDSLILQLFVFPSQPSLPLPGDRRVWVLITCTLAGAAFFTSIEACIWSQMSDNQEGGIQPPSDPAEKAKFDIIAAEWEKERIRTAGIALNAFNVGTIILPLPLILLLSGWALTLAIYLYLVLAVWYGFFIIKHR